MICMIQKFWNEFVENTGRKAVRKGVICFGDSLEAADSAAEAIAKGRKRLVCYPENGYRTAMQGLPAAGELNIAVNWAGEPVCVIETVRVDKFRFNAVSEAVIRAEYPDGENWHEIKEAECKRELEELGLAFDENIMLVAEEFRTIYVKQA